MRDFWQVVCIIAVTITLIPSALMLGIWVTVYGVLLVPLIAIAFLIYRATKRKGWLTATPIPTYATSYKPKKKPIMIKWQGKEIPLGIFIFSMIIAIVLTPIFIICLLFIFPPVVSACILGFMTCKSMGKLAQKGTAC